MVYAWYVRFKKTVKTLTFINDGQSSNKISFPFLLRKESQKTIQENSLKTACLWLLTSWI